MPFRLDPKYGFRAKMQITTSAQMPHMIYRACLATGMLSNTVYVQHAVAHALARDLNIPVEDIIAELPTPRGPSAHLYDPAEATMNRGVSITAAHNGGHARTGPANTDESVR